MREPAWVGWVCVVAGEPQPARGRRRGWVKVAAGNYLPDVMAATAAACPPGHWSQTLAAGAHPGPVAPPGTRLRPKPRVCRSPWLRAKAAVLAALGRGRWVTTRAVHDAIRPCDRAGGFNGLVAFLAWLEAGGEARSRTVARSGGGGGGVEKEWRSA